MKYLIALFLAAAGSQAVAQQNCAPRTTVIQNLAERYGESRRGVALTNIEHLLEFLANDAGEWSIIVTRPDGIACLKAHGTDFELVADPLPPMGQEG